MLSYTGKISENVYDCLTDLQAIQINYCLPQQLIKKKKKEIK